MPNTDAVEYYQTIPNYYLRLLNLKIQAITTNTFSAKIDTFATHNIKNAITLSGSPRKVSMDEQYQTISSSANCPSSERTLVQLAPVR